MRVPRFPLPVAPAFLLGVLGWFALGIGVVRPADAAPGETSAALRQKFADLLAGFPPPQESVEAGAASAAAARRQRDTTYHEFLREKLQDRWFAALVPGEPEQGFAIEHRFETWRGLMDFLAERDVLIDVWAYRETGQPPRRIPATEMAALKRQHPEQPTFLTALWREPDSGRVRTNRIEFGFGAARVARAASEGYHRHRQLQLECREILRARDARGKFSALAQWQALTNAVAEGRLALADRLFPPADAGDPFLAFEFEVDEFNNFTNAVRVYRESEISRRVAYDRTGGATQMVVLHRMGEGPREALGFRMRGLTDQLEPAPNPVLGQDVVELRVRNPSQPEPRRWNALEFGEPAVVRESGLAKFGLLSAHLDRQRKVMAVKKANRDLIAEPIIAGLNVGGGLAGWGIPAGEAARLVYNLLSTRHIADVPTVAELRDLFALLAAKERHPELQARPAHFLGARDIQTLEVEARKLSPDEVQQFLERVSDDDLRAMVALARMRLIDARVTSLLNILTGIAKVSGEAESGLVREIFNNSYYSLNGDVSIKNIICALAGEKIMTPRSGITLEQLANGEGPARAWMQYFDVTFDIRALINTLARLPRKTFAEKELYKPLPYAPNLTDLAAYEVRIFGFPLLMLYKRGLTKADLKAFEEDYAYGLDGPKVVEHFRTREDFDREIRAGRAVPIGYVRVYRGKEGWKDSNLAVFAHRMQRGKRDRMVIVLYGLKAYQEHSDFVDREYRRFLEFERALEQGGVIERLVDAQDRDQLRAVAFEPRLHVGTHASEELYAPLLGALKEVHHQRQLQAWGVPCPPLERLRTRGIEAGEADPLVGVDRHQSTFRYRTWVGGKWREHQMTLIPGPADVARDLAKAQAAERGEEARRAGVSAEGEGVVLLNQVVSVNGRPEIGPPLHDPAGRVVGFGIRAEPQALDAILDRVNRLPVTDRARVVFNRFTATLVDLDVNGDGRTEPVFLTIEFPPDKVIRRDWTNPISGLRETLNFQDGRWTGAVCDRTLLEIEHDAAGRETSSRLFLNIGTRLEPRKGTLLEETRTLQWWLHSTERGSTPETGGTPVPRLPAADPYRPTIVKLRMNHVTGHVSRETFGLFPLPVAVVDGQFITTNRFNPFGLLASAAVVENGRAEADFQRALAQKLREPIAGRPRFALTSSIPALALAGLRDLSAQDFKTRVERTDLARGLTKTLVFDNARLGRKAGESWTDPFDGTTSFTVTATPEYRDDFFLGLIPTRTVLRSGGGRLLAQMETRNYDPLTRRLVGIETDHTGRSSTNLWDPRWENPVEVETALRKTVAEYNRDETAVRGATSAAASGETLRRFTGRFDATNRVWRVQRTTFYAPDITNRVDTETLSGFGKLIATREADVFESRPVYDPHGVEVARRTFRQATPGGPFAQLQRVEEDYQWRAGERTARVQTYVEGQACDTFRIITDAEGRLVTDGVRELPNLTLRTVLTYDGASERVLKAEEVGRALTSAATEKDTLRRTSLPQFAQRQPDGSWLLPVTVLPAWGLAATQTFVLGDPLGRPTHTHYEDGSSTRVLEWFEGTALAKVSESLDRTGRVRERRVRSLNQGTNAGLPFDLTRRHRVGFWGATGLAGVEASMRGTDLVLFAEAADERTFFDLSRAHPAPWFVVDPQGRQGVEVVVGQQRRSNVLAVCRTRLLEGAAGPRLAVDTVDLHGLFYHKVAWRTTDRAGQVLEERVGRIPSLGEQVYSDESLFAAAAQARPTRVFQYFYDRGWLVEQTNAAGPERTRVFTGAEPPAGAGALLVNAEGERELLTRIDAVQIAPEGESAAAGFTSRLLRRVRSPRELEHNPYLPGWADVWTAWTASDLDPRGQELFDLELIYDAQGRERAARAVKGAASGEAATRLACTLAAPPPEALRAHQLTGGQRILTLDAGGREDFSGSDFVYCFGAPPTHAALVVGDASGRRVRVGVPADVARASRPSLNQRVYERGAAAVPADRAPWSPDSANVRWLPDRDLPRQGSLLHAPAALGPESGLVVLSIHELDQAGLDVRRLTSFELAFAEPPPGQVTLSPLFRVNRDGAFIRDQATGTTTAGVEEHGNGLRVFTSETRRQAGARQREFNVVASRNGLPVAVARSRAAASEYPQVLVVDHSQPDSPRPLYAVSPEGGHFLEHYHLLKQGEAQVYTVVQGFELPRVEVYSPRWLADEISPGFMAFGEDYAATIRYERGRGPLGRPLAVLHNRVAANVFKFGGDRLLEAAGVAGRRFQSQFDFAALQDAANQVEAIRKLPLLAQSLLPARDVPWRDAPLSVTPAFSFDTNAVRFALLRERLVYTNTSLIPTLPGTAVERYVDTAQEAELILLAVKLGEVGVARELLEFYWDKSKGGRELLHESYDAMAGTAMTRLMRYERPVHSRRTARAQLAMAEAALALGLHTDDPQWLTLGRNLLSLTLASFRPPAKHPGEPRGLAEFEHSPTRRELGLTLWPEAELYSLASNARAYLLLARLQRLRAQIPDPLWRLEIHEGLREQEAWLRRHILPQAEATGVVPKGVFQIQDIARETAALAVERWTSAEDWLAFLEAAHALGLPPPQLRRWLDNLARSHGTRVDAAWGLDWSIALLRPDAISPELTARFWRIASLVEHTNAAHFALLGLERLKARTGPVAEPGHASASPTLPLDRPAGARSPAEGDRAGVREPSRGSNPTPPSPFPVLLSNARPAAPLETGQGFALWPHTNHQSWPASLAVFNQLVRATEPARRGNAALQTIEVEKVWPRPRTDLAVFVLITLGFYLSILISAVSWWRYRALRRREHAKVEPETLVPEAVMRRAEERWAKRVLGVQTPAGAERTRFSNAPVEQNFLMQLRAIYKLVLEWRRQENGWEEDDPRLVEDETDAWLNGLDEYASFLGLYMRYVIKAGAKDGFARKDRLAENEDSNHVWARLVMYLSEFYWGLHTLVRSYNNLVLPDDKAGVASQMAQVLNTLGVRQRPDGFDARRLFNYPTDPAAMDLLIIQKPGVTLDEVLVVASRKLRIPYLHLVECVERYKEFKRREQPDPIHPYLIEFAKVLPHFLFMGLGALVWYNQRLGDSPIVTYLWTEVVARLAGSGASLGWALPLLGGLVCAVLGHVTRAYRFEASMLPREKAELFLDATLTSLFVKKHSVLPKRKPGRFWTPEPFEWASWGLRAAGFMVLGLTLLRLETPSFATFFVVKGLLAMFCFAEVAAVVLPLVCTAASKFLQDWVTTHPQAGRGVRLANKLNITATRPASLLWLSVKYHTEPSVPTGDFRSLTQAVVFYFLLAAVFLFMGGFLCQQIFSLWFADTYLSASDGKLFFGGLLFWNTMYLLRYGLFVLFTGVASFLATHPVKGIVALVAAGQLFLAKFGGAVGVDLGDFPGSVYGLMGLGLLVLAFEGPLVRCWRKVFQLDLRSARRREETEAKLQQIKAAGSATLGVVYMSGDDLSYQKLTPALLMDRWSVLRERLGSPGLRSLFELAGRPDDATLRGWFQALYDLERHHDVTLWHPMQLVVAGEAPRLRPELGLNLAIDSPAQRQQVLTAWHLRRWLVCMMSTAGHSQDTAINLVEIALRLDQEGLGPHTVFYLIQNKYDNADTNRPTQTPYDRAELAHRNRLARLLCEAAPGCRAYSLQNWTPFGFKAGGLTGMDLAYEESLRLTTMMLLDRNATVHDLDALRDDLAHALTDPDLVIVVPGRGTTNTLTPVGQGSQMVEEGHRSFLQGLMSLLGGQASESLGTGWGNILACYYGRMQRAMTDGRSPKMPLTSRMRRGSSFQVKTEGLIGFAPHAVGISEDTWAVSQAAHNAIALGGRVKFRLSRAFWHKIRETWSHSEWLASFPRWSGGYLQMMHDPIMQQINDFGPVSVFAKEVRANSGRNFLIAPFALLNVMLMPLAIMLDLTPFVQILMVLWNLGFVMNQVLTLHGLNTYLESSGFYRLPAFLGAAGAGALPLLDPGWMPYAPGGILLGFLGGGFFVGLSRWLSTRLRDILLFGPQLVLHTLGQALRQTLEFIVSGASPEDAKGVNVAFRAWAGPREDRPLDTFAHFINLKTVVWIVGLLSVVLNLFALSNLDMLNVLLLLPSLLFSISALVGPFLMAPRRGRPIGDWVFLPKLLGWACSLAFFILVSLLIAERGWLRVLGIVLFVAAFAWVARQGLRYAGYRRKINRARKDLATKLAGCGAELEKAPRLATQLTAQALGDLSKLGAELERAGVPAEHHIALREFLERHLRRLLQAPVQYRQPNRWSDHRFISEFGRSLVFSLLVLVWFCVVPVPGLFVFVAGNYRLSLSLDGILRFVGCTVGAVILAAWAARWVQHLDERAFGRRALRASLERAWSHFQSSLGPPGGFTPAQTARTFALLTEAQTYLDQRSLPYARRTLGLVERTCLAPQDTDSQRER